MAPASGSEVVVAEQVIVIVGACMSMVASLTLVTVIIALTWRGSRKCNISRGENSTRFLTLMVLGFFGSCTCHWHGKVFNVVRH